jgi:hypothetical protein
MYYLTSLEIYHFTLSMDCSASSCSSPLNNRLNLSTGKTLDHSAKRPCFINRFGMTYTAVIKLKAIHTWFVRALDIDYSRYAIVPECFVKPVIAFNILV